MVYLLCDKARQQALADAGQNDWYCYTGQMLDFLGTACKEISFDELIQMEPDEKDMILLPAGQLAESCLEPLKLAIGKGCRVIGFGTMGADELFGVYYQGIAKQENDFAVNGYLIAEPGTLPFDESGTPLPVFADRLLLELYQAKPLAHFEGAEGYPALTQLGNAFYFAFDLPKSLWCGAMGKPVSEGMHGFPLPRVPDTRVLPAEYDTSIAYNDFFLYLLQYILYNMGEPMLHRLPPKQDGTVPELLLYFAGDDDACDKQVTLDAYRVMEQYGLPYHVNLMPAPPDGTSFTLPKEEYDRLKSMGGEFSLHFDFVDAYGGPMTPENFEKQFQLYVKTYGDVPVSPVPHCLVTSGWTERYRYMAALGIKSDHFHGGEVDREDPENINAFNLYGFTFGTAFPAFVFDDAEHHNERIEFLNLPAAYYEPRLRGIEDVKTLQTIHRMVDDAAFFGRPAVMFMHPHYLSGHFEKTEVVFGAVEEALQYGKQKGYTIDFTTPDRLTLWWLARSRSTIEKLAQNRYRVEVDAEDGIVVKLPLQPGKQIMVNGAPAAVVEKTVDGLKWLMVPLTDKGEYELTVQ